MSDKLFGIIVSKINADIVVEALEELGLPHDEDEGLEVWVETLVTHFREKTPIDRLAQCDVCEGKSDALLDVCPFCGTGDEDVDDEPDDEPIDEEPIDEEPIADEPIDEEPIVKAPKGAKKPAESKEQPKAKAAKEKPAKAKAEPKAKASKPKTEPKAKASKPKTEPKAKAEPKEPLAEVIPIKAEIVVPDVDTRFTIKDLDQAVARVNTIIKTGAVLTYELGLELQRIHKEQLWKLRQTKDGLPKYKSFEQFVQGELDISRQTAYEQIDVSANYEKKHVEQIGYKKLALLLKAPESKRETLLEKAEEGASYRELSNDVKEARMDAGGGRRNTGRKEMPAGKPNESGRGGKDAEAQTITVASILGKQTVQLFKSLKKTDGKELIPATSIEDQPWGYVELKNGVIEVFHIAKTNKGLVLQIKRERRK